MSRFDLAPLAPSAKVLKYRAKSKSFEAAVYQAGDLWSADVRFLDSSIPDRTGVRHISGTYEGLKAELGALANRYAPRTDTMNRFAKLNQIKVQYEAIAQQKPAHSKGKSVEDARAAWMAEKAAAKAPKQVVVTASPYSPEETQQIEQAFWQAFALMHSDPAECILCAELSANLRDFLKHEGMLVTLDNLHWALAELISFGMVKNSSHGKRGAEPAVPYSWNRIQQIRAAEKRQAEGAPVERITLQQAKANLKGLSDKELRERVHAENANLGVKRKAAGNPDPRMVPEKAKSPALVAAERLSFEELATLETQRQAQRKLRIHAALRR